MTMSDFRTLLCPILVLAACGEPVPEVPRLGDPCHLEADCAAVDGRCIDGTCHAACEVHADCDPSALCMPGGFCDALEAAECLRDGDCDAPPACRVAVGAVCVLGTCEYPDAEPGSACALPSDVDTPNGRCLGDLCVDCSAGDCCESDAECEAFAVEPVCTDPARCQGQREEAYCDASHHCATRTIDDDSGCAGHVVSVCGRFEDVACTDEVEQVAGTCPTDCENAESPGTPDPSLCDPGLDCLRGPGGFVCSPPLEVGSCCLHPLDCPADVCPGDLRCGADQDPRPVFLCCAAGARCCASDADCSGESEGYACDVAASACHTDCAGDDGRCAEGFHCEASACVADLPDGAPCVDSRDCISRNCSGQPEGTERVCAPQGTCADDGTTHAVGEARCFGDVELAWCEAEGTWAPSRIPSPDPTGSFCLDGAGYEAPASCTPGGFQAPGCVSCEPYVAASTTACITYCAHESDAFCFPGYHCDADACVPDLALSAGCDEDSDCESGNCALDEGLGARVCAPADSCLLDGVAYAVGDGLCSDDGATFRPCLAPGTWATGDVYRPDTADDLCNPGTGYNSGIDLAATCTQGGFDDPPCVSCVPFRPQSASACHATCTNNAQCYAGNHCYSGDHLCYSNGNGSPCDVDSHCASGRCDATCLDKLPDGSACDEVSDCAGGRCSGGVCGTLLANGETCAVDQDCLSRRCDGTCMAKLADGASCDEDSDCLNDWCYYGSCITSGTCPMVYTWEGSRFAFESDVFTKGMLGLRYSFGYKKPNPHDYYLLEHQPVAAGGALELRLVEERFEVDYLDEAKLYTLETPADRDVVAEISFVGTSWVPPLSLLHTVARPLQQPRSAVHVETGEDVTAVIGTSDGNFLTLSEHRNDDFDWNTIELDLGNLAGAPMVKLVIDARSAFPTSPAGLALASQLDDNGQRSRIEVQDAQGQWVRIDPAVAVLPLPKEFRRRFVFDVSGLLTGGSSRIRLGFLYKTHVDSILFDTTADVPIVLQEVPLQSADLRYYGFSAKSREGTEIYDLLYGQTVGPMYGYMPGDYTRYGDVMPLLSVSDDMFAIFGSGDEIALRFAEPPPLGAGRARRFMLYSNGYYKAAKTNVAHTVEPLPFSAMSNFPYDPQVESYPDDTAHQTYQSTWNTRYEN